MIIPEPSRRRRAAQVPADLTAAEAIVFGAQDGDAGLDYQDIAPVTTDLSRREEQVLTMVARGHSNVDTARVLGLSVETVKSHMRRVLGKLGARNRCHAVALAYERGLFAPGTLSQEAGAATATRPAGSGASPPPR